jgi:hypothetical protein
MLQSKAGYIDARPHIPQLDEVLLQRTAGPYIGSQDDIPGSSPRVRFTLESGHPGFMSTCPRRGRPGLSQGAGRLSDWPFGQQT